MSAAAALKNIEIMENERLVENSDEVGAYFREQLRSLRDDHAIVGGVRGLGLLIVFDLVRDRATNEDYPPEANIGERLTEKVLARGLHLMCNDTCVRIAPPISITPVRGGRDGRRLRRRPRRAGSRAIGVRLARGPGNHSSRLSASRGSTAAIGERT